jgi:hypothetical protein
MFHAWKQEKATAALVEEAQALADKLAGTKPHFLDSQAAHAQLWAATLLAEGQDVDDLTHWPAARVTKFIKATQTRIAALRKAREYDSSDGLAIWLHTARAVIEPRIAPAVREIWQHLLAAGPNAAPMAEDLLQDAGLPTDQTLRCPAGFGSQD